MLTIDCREQQALEIGKNVEITVLEIGQGIVRLGIYAPGLGLTQLDPVPLPVGASELRLVNLEYVPVWPPGMNGGQK